MIKNLINPYIRLLLSEKTLIVAFSFSVFLLFLNVLFWVLCYQPEVSRLGEVETRLSALKRESSLIQSLNSLVDDLTIYEQGIAELEAKWQNKVVGTVLFSEISSALVSSSVAVKNENYSRVKEREGALFTKVSLNVESDFSQLVNLLLSFKELSYLSQIDSLQVVRDDDGSLVSSIDVVVFSKVESGE